MFADLGFVDGGGGARTVHMEQESKEEGARDGGDSGGIMSVWLSVDAGDLTLVIV